MRTRTATLLGASLLVLLIAAVFAGYKAFTLYTLNVKSGASQQQKTILVIKNPPALDVVWDKFRVAMNEHGYAEGVDIQYVPIAVGSDDLSVTKAKIVAILKREHIDLIYTMGILATRAAKEATDELSISTPVVFAVVSDPVGSGLVTSLSSSGNNLTGVTPVNNFVVLKRLGLLKEMLPDAKRIVYAWHDERTSSVDVIRKSIPDLGFEFDEHYVENPDALMTFLENFPFEKGDVLLRASDSVGATALKGTILTALAKKIPLIGTNATDVTRGALMSYGANYGDIGAQSARLVDRVLKGENPKDIPIEDAENFELSVNLDTAKGLGLDIPNEFLLKTHHIISTE